jgi:prevent-host-death family protein
MHILPILYNSKYNTLMPKVSATYAKQNFAAMLDQAQHEPVRIQRHDRDVAVILSAAEYERIRGLRVKELLRLSQEASRQAQSRGLTEEILQQILADKQ